MKGLRTAYLYTVLAENTQTAAAAAAARSRSDLALLGKALHAQQDKAKGQALQQAASGGGARVRWRWPRA